MNQESSVKNELGVPLSENTRATLKSGKFGAFIQVSRQLKDEQWQNQPLTVEQAWKLVRFAKRTPQIVNYGEKCLRINDKNDSWIGGHRYANAFTSNGRTWILVTTSTQEGNDAWRSDLFNMSFKEAIALEQLLKFIEKQAKSGDAPQQQHQKAGDPAEEKMARDIEAMNASAPQSDSGAPIVPI